MKKLQSPVKIFFLFLIFLNLTLSGCAPPTSGTGPGRMLALEPDYTYKIEKIDMAETKEQEVDAKELLRSALEKALRDKDLLWGVSSGEKYYTISIRIIDYEMGNAFKRWLLPTYGSTILSVHTDINDPKKNEVVTYMEHKQTIAAGGLYSAGAWKYVFDNVANDIVIDLERKFSGSGEGFFVQLNPWLENETEAPKATVKKNISLLPFQDMRVEKNRIGERQAAFNVSMGDIYANRDVLVYVREAIQNELLASGNSLSTENTPDVKISGDLIRFWVWTDTTPLYWDIRGEIELKMTATSPEGDKKIDRTYKAKSEARTYVWPTENLAATVMSDTVKSLMYNIRKDSIWTSF